jgi:hypothetical protein
MTFEEFHGELKSKITLGKVMKNPGRGESTIIAYTQKGNICYQRGESCISISLIEIYNAYQHYSGKQCSSTDLKALNPRVFGTQGHGCNCSFFFMVLREMGLCSEIKRVGDGNSPFCVDVF